MRLTMIDVGQGEALLVQFPGGESLLVDAANASPSFDLGERVVVPSAQALGIRRLDWIAITHPDLDHIGGARAVVDLLDVREVWEGVPVPQNAERRALRDLVVSRGGVWRTLQARDRTSVGEVSIDVLHPPLPDWERQKVRNDDSLVLRFCYGQVEFLLTGDVGGAVERELGSGREERPLRVLKVAHHGSRSSTDEQFLSAYSPLVALVSAGAGNVFGHPAPAVLRRLSEQQTNVFRTDQSGAVIVETDGASVRVKSWAGERWQAAMWRSSS